MKRSLYTSHLSLEWIIKFRYWWNEGVSYQRGCSESIKESLSYAQDFVLWRKCILVDGPFELWVISVLPKLPEICL